MRRFSMSKFAINRRQLLQAGGVGGLAAALAAMSQGVAEAAPKQQGAGGPQILDLGLQRSDHQRRRSAGSRSGLGARPCWPAASVGHQGRWNGPSNTSPRAASLPLPNDGWKVGTTDRCQFPGEGLDSAHNPSRGELQNPSLIPCSGRADRSVFWAQQNRNRP
ncbi:twin-arginine translocation signal domain-containing protein [Pseudarthrobacter cellobiosi]|uniref:twin-arginine translocation signal domain-containing protein n=1 Tax=Pseudarthrobacter cellobiosi TaxID=2953654 RepID=UPI0027E2486D|nr:MULTISPECIES: twin-arginine translocation signal domain-containing protein [unclassified Pseudarthrobacter]